MQLLANFSSFDLVTTVTEKIKYKASYKEIRLFSRIN